MSRTIITDLERVVEHMKTQSVYLGKLLLTEPTFEKKLRMRGEIKTLGHLSHTLELIIENNSSTQTIKGENE